ncbi:MAG: altronate dehydratase [Lachnospiraceae bacterium]|nr:altronate dehydratase [Lachnospiraceae bacterium]
MQDIIRIHEKDNVAVALRDIAAGERPWGEIMAAEPIPAGHKMAICHIPAGGQVIKYGHCIGMVKEPVPPGAWVHTHNLETALGDLLEYEYRPVWADGEKRAGGELSDTGKAGYVFEGFRRRDGKTGVRNEIWIIPTVGCVNNVAAAIARQANEWLADFRHACGSPKGSPKQGPGGAEICSGAGAEARPEVGAEACPGAGVETCPGAGVETCFEAGTETCPGAGPGSGLCGGCTVEEVIAFPHPYGCSQMGEDQEYTRKILTNLVKHPNAGGVLVLGLGCENSNIHVLKPYIGAFDADRVKFLEAQECGDEVARGLEIVKGLVSYAGAFQREPISVSELVIGLKCGGSDGLSGITANPLVGHFSDKLIAAGGTTILTEVPEMFGAETILMNRCANEELFERTVMLINDFKNYYKSHGQTIYENPSPGNKKGGISTLEDKSLGCTQKSGSALVQGVLPYGGIVEEKGLNLLSAPGNDLVAATALAAAGAHIVLFTTGRGTPFASPVPTVKISTNSGLAQKKSNWIDFNAGVLAEESGMERETEALFDYVLEVASGRKVSSEEAGYHDMAIFKQGVTL